MDIDWASAALSACPGPVRQLALGFLQGQSAPGTFLECMAAAARLGCMAIGDRPCLLDAAAAALAAADAAVQTERKDGKAEGKVFAEAACRIRLALAYQTGSLSELQAALNTKALSSLCLCACAAQALKRDDPSRSLGLLAMARQARHCEALPGVPWLLRQMAVCKLLLGEPAEAVSLAEVAEAECGGADAMRVASLRLVVRARCRMEHTTADADKLAVACEALCAASSREALYASQELLAFGHHSLAELLISRHEEKREIPRLQLAIRVLRAESEAKALLKPSDVAADAAMSAEPAPEGAANFKEVVAVAAKLLGSPPPRLAAEQSKLLWNVARRGLDTAPALAAAWLQLPGLAVLHPEAPRALCLLLAGLQAEAAEAAEAARRSDRSDAIPPAVQLLLSATPPSQDTASQVAGSRAEAAAKLSSSAANCLGRVVAAMGPGPTALVCLETLDDPEALLHLAVSVLGDANCSNASVKRTLAALSRHGQRGRTLFERLWNAAVSMGRSGQFSAAAALFLAAHSSLSTDSASETCQRNREDAQMCLVAHMALLLQAARTGKDARAVLRCAAQAKAACGPNAGDGKALQMVLLMEFEARVLVADPELNQFIASAQNLPPKCFLVMARASLKAGHRQVAMQCLGIFLRATADAAAAGCHEPLGLFALALRELVNLHSLRDESVGCFDEALALLRKAPRLAPSYPARELQWLIALAWKNGAHHGRQGNLPLAKRWLAIAGGLLDFCPAMAKYGPQMAKAYRCC